MSSSQLELAGLTADVVAAYVANNVISGDKLPEFNRAPLKSSTIVNRQGRNML
jgi:predicted transcriptional regulator